jgi:3-dehydrosphinganine reductase
MKKTKNIVITGGSSGLGLALSEAFAKKGYRIAIVARDNEKLKIAGEQLKKKFPNVSVSTFSLDVTQSEGLADGFDRINRILGSIDMLINCAGILKEGYFEKLSDKDLRSVMDVNYFGVLNATRAALPYLKKSQGRLVNIASMAGLTGVFGYTAYCGSKHALIGASDVLRVELKPQGIKVQVVCPGEFDSPMVDTLDKYRTPENKEHTLTIPKASVEVIVKGIMKGIKSNDFMIFPNTLTKGVALSMRWFPWISRMVGDKKVKSVYVGPTS